MSQRTDAHSLAGPSWKAQHLPILRHLFSPPFPFALDLLEVYILRYSISSPALLVPLVPDQNSNTFEPSFHPPLSPSPPRPLSCHFRPIECSTEVWSKTTLFGRGTPLDARSNFKSSFSIGHRPDAGCTSRRRSLFVRVWFVCFLSRDFCRPISPPSSLHFTSFFFSLRITFFPQLSTFPMITGFSPVPGQRALTEPHPFAISPPHDAATGVHPEPSPPVWVLLPIYQLVIFPPRDRPPLMSPLLRRVISLPLLTRCFLF